MGLVYVAEFTLTAVWVIQYLGKGGYNESNSATEVRKIYITVVDYTNHHYGAESRITVSETVNELLILL